MESGEAGDPGVLVLFKQEKNKDPDSVTTRCLSMEGLTVLVLSLMKLTVQVKSVNSYYLPKQLLEGGVVGDLGAYVTPKQGEN